jgi:hypothetical protein
VTVRARLDLVREAARTNAFNRESGRLKREASDGGGAGPDGGFAPARAGLAPCRRVTWHILGVIGYQLWYGNRAALHIMQVPRFLLLDGRCRVCGGNARLEPRSGDAGHRTLQGYR